MQKTPSTQARRKIHRCIVAVGKESGTAGEGRNLVTFSHRFEFGFRSLQGSGAVGVRIESDGLGRPGLLARVLARRLIDEYSQTQFARHILAGQHVFLGED